MTQYRTKMDPIRVSRKSLEAALKLCCQKDMSRIPEMTPTIEAREASTYRVSLVSCSRIDQNIENSFLRLVPVF